MHNNIEEVWKEIPGFTRYKVSNLGRVTGILVEYLKWQKSSVRDNGGPYPFVDLRGIDCDGKYIRKCAFVHHLVAKNFIGPRPKGMVIHHKDHNRWNPRVDNLEYITIEENRHV